MIAPAGAGGRPARYKLSKTKNNVMLRTTAAAAARRLNFRSLDTICPRGDLDQLGFGGYALKGKTPIKE